MLAVEIEVGAGGRGGETFDFLTDLSERWEDHLLRTRLAKAASEFLHLLLTNIRIGKSGQIGNG